MYAVLRMARRRAPLAIGSALLVIAVIYGVGSVLTDDGRSLPPARVVMFGIVAVVLIVAGLLQRRARRRAHQQLSDGRKPQ